MQLLEVRHIRQLGGTCITESRLHGCSSRHPLGSDVHLGNKELPWRGLSVSQGRRGILDWAPNSQTDHSGRREPIASTTELQALCGHGSGLASCVIVGMLSGTKGALLPSVLKHPVSRPHRALSSSIGIKEERGLGQQAAACRSKMTELHISGSEKRRDRHKDCTSRGAGLARPVIVP